MIICQCANTDIKNKITEIIIQKNKMQQIKKEYQTKKPAEKKLNIIRIEKPTDKSKITLKENTSNYIFVSNDLSREISLECEENSKTKYVEINNPNKIIEVKRKLNLAKNASLEFFSIYAGEANSNTSTYATLSDDSSVLLRNIIISYNQEQNHDITVVHNGKNSKSDLLSRGVLSHSKITLKGLIQINVNAEDSEGYQKSDLLILNDSQAISIPDLQIHNNNVKCSHGSSITRLDKEKIFYLQSRGFNEGDAKAALLNAHLSSITSELNEDEKNSKKINEIISQKLFKILAVKS